MGLLQDIDTSKLKISSNYIDKDNKWVGLSKRIRTIVYSKECKRKSF